MFSQFFNYLPLEKSRALKLKKLESPSPNDDLCQVSLELAQRFLKRRFFKFVNISSSFRNYLPLERAWPFIWTNSYSLHPRTLCAKFGWNCLSGSEEDENVKSLRTDVQMEDGRQAIRKAHLSLWRRWAKKMCLNVFIQFFLISKERYRDFIYLLLNKSLEILDRFRDTHVYIKSTLGADFITVYREKMYIFQINILSNFCIIALSKCLLISRNTRPQDH